VNGKTASWPGRIAVWLVCAMVFTLPFEKAIQIPGMGTVARMAGWLAFAAGVAVVARRRAFRPLNAILLFGAAFAAWSGMTWLWSLEPGVTALRAATLAQLFAMLWLVWELCPSDAAQRLMMEAYVAGAAVSSVWTMIRAAHNQQTYYRRFATAGFDPNDLAVTLALALPMALYLSRRGGVRAWFARAGAALAIPAILLTASRTALIAAALGFAFVVFTWRGSALSHRISSVALALLLLAGLVRLAPAASRERLASLPNELAGGNFHNRTRIWKTGLKLLKRRGVFGVGAGAYPTAVYPWLGKPPIPGHEYTAHNTFLSVLVETGVVGFALYAALLGSAALFAWLLDATGRALWFTSLAVWAVSVSTLTWENRKPSWLLFALIAAAWGRAFDDSQERQP
jgi:O-antigen ligase